MKVALLTDGIYPYVMGGMQKHSYYLAKYLAKEKVQVVLYHTGPAEADTSNLVGFTEEELAFIVPVFIPFPILGRFPGHYVVESYLYSSRIYKDLSEQTDVDFIYVQGFTGWKTALANKKRSKLPPIGINFHGVEMFQKTPNLNVELQHLLLRAPVKNNLRNADYIFSLGGKLTALQQAITPKPILVTPIGIESSWLSTIDEVYRSVRRFVFIGRNERRKGIEELHDVLEELVVKHNFEFYFIGPISEEKQLNRSNIKYLGLIKDEKDIKQVLSNADILVCPSYSEGMPTVILEAMASGLGIIATDVGAVGTMVSKKNGWLIPPADKESLKQAILEANNLNCEALCQMKKESIKLVEEQFTWDKVIELILAKITSVVNK